MSHVISPSGSRVELPDLDGVTSLVQLYQDVACSDLTEKYRAACARACALLGRQGWGVLGTLKDIRRSQPAGILLNEVKAAIKAIDPGEPTLESAATTTSTSTVPNRRYPREKTFPVYDGVTTVYRSLERRKVSISQLSGSLMDGCKLSSACNFCEKICLVDDRDREYRKAFGSDYCNYCIAREVYRPRKARNTMLLTFRGILGYYYHSFYVVPKSSGMWCGDIQAIADLHFRVGRQNPVFSYDHDSFLWFVDFSRVGDRRCQVPLTSVLETVVRCLAAFSIPEHAPAISTTTLFDRYRTAITDFHHHRSRPPGQRVLAPTPYGCGIPVDPTSPRAVAAGLLKQFQSCHLVENIKRIPHR